MRRELEIEMKKQATKKRQNKEEKQVWKMKRRLLWRWKGRLQTPGEEEEEELEGL